MATAHQLNLDAQQRELDRRNAEGEDVSHLRVNPQTGAIERALIEAPALDCDATTFRSDNTSIHARMRTERKLIANLIAHLDAAGFKLHAVNDGEERHKVSDMKTAMEHIFAVDESALFVRKLDAKKSHTLLIVLGNDGWDCVADHSLCDEDGFTAAMEAFDFDQFA